MNATPPDRELVRRLRAGDELAFDHLYDRYAPALYQFALRLTGGDETDAADVLQETWLRAIPRLGGFRWESSLRTWLMGIGLNASRELTRQRGREHTPLGAQTAGGPVPSPVARLDLERAIASLPADWRTVVVLHDIEGFPHADIARRLGIAEGTSRSRLHRARARLRTLIAPTDRDMEERDE